MGTPITPSQLRQDVYRLIDRVLDTGEPLEIERRGRRLRLTAEEPVDRLSLIHTDPHAIVGNPETLAHIDWSPEWDVDRSVEP